MGTLDGSRGGCLHPKNFPLPLPLLPEKVLHLGLGAITVSAVLDSSNLGCLMSPGLGVWPSFLFPFPVVADGGRLSRGVLPFLSFCL